MSTFTPGPWHWGDGWVPETFGDGDDEFGSEKYADLRLLGANGEEIIPLRIDHYNFFFDQASSIEAIPTADRTLIASAPELYEALDLAPEPPPKMAELREIGAFLSNYAAWWERRCALLAKAEGR